MPPELQVQRCEDGEDESRGKPCPTEGICSRLGWSGEENRVRRYSMGDREDSAKDDAVVPLERLLLRGNLITVRTGGVQGPEVGPRASRSASHSSLSNQKRFN